MTADRNRQPEGIPAGGQFAAETRSDAVVALAPVPAIEYRAALTGNIELSTQWLEELPEWPTTLPEPEVNFGFDNGKAETYVVIDGKMMTFWDSDFDGVIDDTDTGSNAWEDYDEEDQELAREWGKAVHRRVDDATYGVMMEGSHCPAVKNIILAQALGKEPGPAKAGPDLTDRAVRDAYVIDAAARLADANKELQRVYMIGAAQELRKEFPAIDSFSLVVDDKYLRISEAWDADGNLLDNATLGAASDSIFRYRNEDDFTTFTEGGIITVSDAIAFRPGS